MQGLGGAFAGLGAFDWEGAVAGDSHDLLRVRDFGPNPGALGGWLHLPEGLEPGAALVVVLHGCGQTAAAYAAGAGWVELADRHGFALLCPEQARTNNINRCFNWFQPGDADRDRGEAASIAQMTRWAIGTHRLDPRRVFVTGLSAGGAMATVMLAAYPELFAAGAVIAGLPYGAAQGAGEALRAMRQLPDLPARAWGDKVRDAAPVARRWPRISIWRGEADTTVTPLAGEALARQWCDLHGAGGPGELSADSRGFSRTTWRGTDGRVAVEFYSLPGLGHGVPISSRGESGHGRPGPWILEAGIPSSLKIARFWGLIEPVRPPSRATPRRRPAAPPAGRRSPTLKSGLRKVLSGLLRRLDRPD